MPRTSCLSRSGQIVTFTPISYIWNVAFRINELQATLAGSPFVQCLLNQAVETCNPYTHLPHYRNNKFLDGNTDRGDGDRVGTASVLWSMVFLGMNKIFTPLWASATEATGFWWGYFTIVSHPGLPLPQVFHSLLGLSNILLRDWTVECEPSRTNQMI